MNSNIERLEKLVFEWREAANAPISKHASEQSHEVIAMSNLEIVGCADELASLVKEIKTSTPALPLGTKTQWGKVVKYGPAYWLADENGGATVAIDAGMLEADARPSSR